MIRGQAATAAASVRGPLSDEGDSRCVGTVQWEEESVGRHGPTNVVPLAEVAPELGEQVESALIFDALGHDPQPHGVTKLDGGAHELNITLPAIRGQVYDEDAVKLELAHSQVAQVGQGR